VLIVLVVFSVSGIMSALTISQLCFMYLNDVFCVLVCRTSWFTAVCKIQQNWYPLVTTAMPVCLFGAVEEK